MSTPEYAGSEQFDFGQVAATKFKVRGYMPRDIRNIGMVNSNSVQYTIKENDKLSLIAISNGVRPTDIRIWNNLTYGRLLIKGMILNLYPESNDGSIKEYNYDGTNVKEVNKDVTENNTPSGNENQQNSDEGISYFDKIVKGKESNTTNTERKRIKYYKYRNKEERNS